MRDPEHSSDRAKARQQVGEAQSLAALADLREEIDGLDRSLLDLLVRRADLARDISRIKRALHRPVQDPERERAAFEERRAWAVELGLDPDFVERIFAEILVWSRGVQEREQEEGPR